MMDSLIELSLTSNKHGNKDRLTTRWLYEKRFKSIQYFQFKKETRENLM